MNATFRVVINLNISYIQILINSTMCLKLIIKSHGRKIEEIIYFLFSFG